MDRAAPIPKPTPTMNNDKKDIKFLEEYKLKFDNIDYLLKVGKIINEIEEIIFFVKEEKIIEACYYQNNFSLENLQKMN